jgi:uncharacterized protein YndB with AHSA1/START domain
VEWTGARYADKPTVEVRTWIGAPPARVWQLVSDVELMPAMSSELQSVEWLDGASGPALGARFVGRSKHEALGEWATTSQVVEFEPERVFGWAVDDPANPAALWRFRLEPKDGGTELSEWVQMGPARSGLSQAIDRMPDKEQKIVFVRMREFERNITATLEQIKKLAESGASTLLDVAAGTPAPTPGTASASGGRPPGHALQLMRASSRTVSRAVSRGRVSRWTWARRRPPWSTARRVTARSSGSVPSGRCPAP